MKISAPAERAFSFVQPVAMRRDRTALLVIDMQVSQTMAEMLGDSSSHSLFRYYVERVNSTVIPAIRTLQGYFRAHRMPVIYLAFGSLRRDLGDVPKRLQRTMREIEERSGRADLYWASNADAYAIRPEVAPSADEVVINKTTYGGFTSSDIESVLDDLGVDTLVITGVSTNCCVESTAREASDRDFACVVVNDATADFDDKAHEAALRGIGFSFGRVMRSADEVIAALDAETIV